MTRAEVIDRVVIDRFEESRRVVICELCKWSSVTDEADYPCSHCIHNSKHVHDYSFSTVSTSIKSCPSCRHYLSVYHVQHGFVCPFCGIRLEYVHLYGISGKWLTLREVTA